MKPLNYQERKNLFIRFLMASLTVLGLFGYSIYASVFVQGEIEEIDSTMVQEISSLERFLNKANNHVKNFQDADNNTDRSSHQIELNRLIRDYSGEYGAHKKIFFEISERYRDVLRASERRQVSQEDNNLECKDQIEELEKQIEDLDLQIEEFIEHADEIVTTKEGLVRIAEELVLTGDDLGAKDWCKGPGEGKDEIKEELKMRLRLLQKDVLFRTENL